ncbi:MAG: hypothetical protein Rubg2KO_16670 [Rubricoccaceae bacterium]
MASPSASCLAALLWLLASPLHAQPITIGLKAGATQATIYSGPNDPFQTRFRTGFTAGAFATVPLNSRFAVHPEAVVVRRGTRTDGFLANGEILETTYLDVPVLLAHTFPLAGIPGSDGHVAVGPTVGVKLSEQARRIRYFTGVRFVEELDTPFVNPLDVSVSLAGGTTFKAGRARIGLDVRYAYGLVDTARQPDYLSVLSGDERTSAIESVNKNRSFSFSLSVGLAISPDRPR